MTIHFRSPDRIRNFAVIFLLLIVTSVLGLAQNGQTVAAQAGQCRVEAVEYKGWHAQQMSNQWVQLIVVPQNGGRLMQVTFNGHPFLFVNRELAGKYFPPTAGHWYNYGGDKLWPLPEGNDDEKHWVGDSDVLDDGPFSFRKVSEGDQCEIELTGPADRQTGIQYQRTIGIGTDSPRIRFHATMKNISGHPIEWSMQSVSQYDTSNFSSSTPANYNHNFWAFTPANSASSYLNQYHVRFGPAENPSVAVRDDGLFSLHYAHMAAELWLDSIEGWLAVVDEASEYAMVERFQYQENKPYPGKASVIFWTNGPEMHLDKNGEPALSADPDASPTYLEAELNSPLCRLRPGQTCAFETEWFPTRAGAEFHGVKDSGIVIHPLQCSMLADGKLKLSGEFGVLWPGMLVAHFYDDHGASLGTSTVSQVDPTKPLVLDNETTAPPRTARVSLHVEDKGTDYGSLGEVAVSGAGNR
ncbi:MAG TPA: hypothetical protein VGG14_08515 [Candidatus Sulfotelmatobacter sp.]